MTIRIFPTARIALACAAGLIAASTLQPALAGGAAKHASSTAANSDALATYRMERDNCLSGRSHQDRATCLREAGAAYAEARQGRLGNDLDAATLRANALQRCQRQPPEDRADCERLVRGEGRQVGSVAEGAVIKELVTRTVGAPST